MFFVEVMTVNAIRETLGRNNFQLSLTVAHDTRDFDQTYSLWFYD